ncbi:hypothetical protein Fleli_1532 [Bernardetia litoralis DSM 6794]|uniref:Glycosyltransferase RgtA/B/C/D-like domain-containing protein n=1 Tax=Bernardetia litoralis (strain ATCC 23117 / DSM 6794 / NBRC 15988 / NCIMB 1366 / Fx l1 / Sio-4) TaxID=880071 RepID=I4AJ18_BERLS|nr:hypothetical protein [Bernardetia litoralis]AFM03953.1 hypothetical protein Fleli_1532 [Bernardetia litoralis DSM 6794]
MLSHFFSFKNLDSNSKIRFLIGFLILLIFQIWSTYKGEGIAKTHDSFQYLQTAENLILQSDFIQKEAQPYIAWALGFPFLLILFKDSIFLNLICLLGVYIFYFDLIQKLFQKTLMKWWLILAFSFATPLYLIHHFVWSEPPFLLFLIACIWAFYYLIDNQKCFWFCFFGFLFCAMRNAGLYFVIGINSGIILFYMLPSLNKKEFTIPILWKNSYFKSLVYFSFSSTLPIFLWWIHAKIKTEGNFDTIYNLALRTFLEECLNYGDILSRWFFPPSIPLEIRLSFFVLSLILFLFYFFKKIKLETDKNTNFILFIFWITFVYLIGMLLSRAGMKIDAERFLAIIYPFLLILIGFILEKLKTNDFLKYGIAFLWLAYPLLRTLKNIIFWN